MRLRSNEIIPSSPVALAILAAPKNEADVPKPIESSATSSAMVNIPIGAEMKHGTAAGADMITLDHGAMSIIGWPAMKTGFAIKPELLAGIKVGDKVNFEIDWDGKAGMVTNIAKTEK